MRIGLALSASPDADPLESLTTQARAAEAAGLDLAWLEAGDGPPLITAAALAGRTEAIRLAACVPVDGHPLAIAEAACVADNCSNGRLVLVLEDAEGDSELLAETVDLILAALAGRPFVHDGARWRSPAKLPENEPFEERIAVTPAAVQPELPVWLAGSGAASVAKTRALSPVARDLGTAPDVWTEVDAGLGPVAYRMRRPAVVALDSDGRGEFDVDAVVERVGAAQRDWGLDLVVLRPPAGLGDSARTRVVARLASQVRPRVTMHQLPAGLDAYWKAERP